MAETRLAERDLLLAPALSPAEVAEILRKYRFDDPARIDKHLQRIAKEAYQRELFAEVAVDFLEAIAASPDPEMAINHFERFCDASIDRNFLFSLFKSDPMMFQLLIPLFGASPFLSEILIRNPEYLWWLRDEAACPKSKREMLAELRRTVSPLSDPQAKGNALRRFKRREILRIGFRDIVGKADVRDITEELSNLADVLLQIIYEACLQELKNTYGEPLCLNDDRAEKEAAFAVIGMGKLGGSELNFSSDIDLMFIYEKDGETTGRLEQGERVGRIGNRLYFTKLGEQIVRAIGEITEEGYCYRVDMRLRPEGRFGVLVRSLDSYRAYYESWGETWERQALLKARCVAGDPCLGEQFLEWLQPFVYRKYLDYFAISEIGQMKESIDRKVGTRGETFRQVKLGYGGIREIEFIVQALQLIYGGREPEIRERNTLAALQKLCEHDYLTPSDYATLTSAYKFLRIVEHRLQMNYELQTHTLPKSESELKKLARQLGYHDGEKPAIERFMDDYNRHTAAVRSIFEDLFYQLNDGGQSVPPEVGLITQLASDKQPAADLIKRYGFCDAGGALRNLELIIKGGETHPPLSARERRLFANLMPELLTQIGRSPNPDLALNHFERFISNVSARSGYLKVLAENPKSIELLISLFGCSEFLSQVLIRTPSLFDTLVESRLLGASKSRTIMAEELTEVINASASYDETLNSIRRYKKRELLRIGLNDLLGLSDIQAVTGELSDLADACLHAAYRYGYREVTEKYSPLDLAEEGSWPRPTFAVIGLGKLGGREIGYGSDLDLVFVYSAAGEPAAKVSLPHLFAEQVRNILDIISGVTEEGWLFKTDIRLRPLGRDGPLALPLVAYERYFQEQAETWERQALIKCRFVAGDPDLGSKFVAAAHRFVYQRPVRSEEIFEIARMRERMEQELVDPDHARSDVKLSAGGIVDIEFIAQLLQLKVGWADPHVREPGTIRALRQLMRGGHLAPHDHDQLHDAYQFFRRLENRLRIVHDTPLDILPDSHEELEGLAKSLGYRSDEAAAAAKLRGEFQAHRKTVRAIYNKIFHH